LRSGCLQPDFNRHILRFTVTRRQSRLWYSDPQPRQQPKATCAAAAPP